jgi:hypothetical protein
MTHQYQVRQLVRLTNSRASSGRESSTGAFEVTRLMPADQTGALSYRIRSSTSGERAVGEWEIAAMAGEHS